VALLGLTACYPTSVTQEVVAVGHGGDAGSVLVTVVRDDGTEQHRIWWRTDVKGEKLLPGDADAAPGRVEDCAGADCYRIVPGRLAVEERHASGQEYTTAWQVTGDTYTKLAKSYPALGDPAVHLASRSVVVVAVPDGHAVFVANGRDGLLYRDPAGAWHRRGTPSGGEGVFYERPNRLATDPQPIDPAPIVAAVVAALVLAAAGLTAATRRTLRVSRAALVLPIAATAAAMSALSVHYPPVGMFPGIFYGGQIILVALGAAGALAVVLVWTPRRTPRRTPRPVRSPGTAAATTTAPPPVRPGPPT
jgi:hypothetical protein